MATHPNSKQVYWYWYEHIAVWWIAARCCKAKHQFLDLLLLKYNWWPLFLKHSLLNCFSGLFLLRKKTLHGCLRKLHVLLFSLQVLFDLYFNQTKQTFNLASAWQVPLPQPLPLPVTAVPVLFSSFVHFPTDSNAVPVLVLVLLLTA